MRVLISGAGLAGLSLAFGLTRGGHAVVVVEQAPSLRDVGYMIDFSGPGYDVCERWGLLPALREIHYPIARLRFLDSRGHEKFSVPYPTLRRLFDNRHFNFMRGESSACCTIGSLRTSGCDSGPRSTSSPRTAAA